MRVSRIVLLLVALIAGGLAAFLATRGGGDAPVRLVEGPQVVVEEKKAQFLVAIAPIGVGQRLSQEVVQWEDWPEGALRADYITLAAMPDALDQVTGAVARFEIFPGDPVTEAKLVRAEQGYLSAVLAKGKRGVSVAVQADSASGGFIVPNDRVDVVLTSPGDNGQVSRTILSNVKVLAIGVRLGEIGTTGGPSDPEDPKAEVFRDNSIATLELDPVQAETIINASKIGSLSLALRSMADFDEVEALPTQRRRTNQAVRMIKFGQESNVSAGDAGGAPENSELSLVEPAAFNPDVVVEPTVVPEATDIAVPEATPAEPVGVEE